MHQATRAAASSRATPPIGLSPPTRIQPHIDESVTPDRAPPPTPWALWFWAEPPVPLPEVWPHRPPPRPAHVRGTGLLATLLGLLSLLLLSGCGADAPPETDSVAQADVALVTETQDQLTQAARHVPGLHYDGSLRDAIEFFRPHDGGNGRSCATCHRPEDNFALTPQTVEARWQNLQARRKTDPQADDPLFRPLDADDFANDFTTLRTKALVRVTLPLPANVKRADDAAAATTTVWRAVPTVINAKFGAPYQHDGREPTLESQAEAAIHAHSQANDPPAQARIAHIVRFQQHLFSSTRVARLAQALDAGETTPPSADRPLSALEQRGHKTFEKFCATCHGGPTLTHNTDARFLPVPARGPRGNGGEEFVNVFISTPRPPPPGLPAPARTPRFFDGLPSAGLGETTFRITLPNGAQVPAASSDAGRGLITGDLREFGRFDVPTLYGIARTAPYFHDNSAPDLDAVIAQYQAMFKFMQFLDVEGGFFAPPANGQGCAAGTCGFTPIPEEDVPALKAYLLQLGN